MADNKTSTTTSGTGPERLLDTERFNNLVRGRYGYVLYNTNDVYVGRSLERYGEYSEFEVALFRQVCGASDIIVDVGAYIGTHTLAMSALVGNSGRVFALEPQRVVFQTLCANMALNSVVNVECLQVAASAENGRLLMPDIRYDIEANFGGICLRGFDKGRPISTRRLDDLIDVPRLRLMKFDVEGMEHEAISGAAGLIAQHQPILYVENDRQEGSKDLIDLIMSMDYRLYWHAPPLFNPDNYAGDDENIFPGVVSINMVCIHRNANVTVETLPEIVDPASHPLDSQYGHGWR
ncbi:MAG: FkbM family methyltransferase [Gammaproteobacteria bacterium]|nr:FkbM family methyltransferase [Gammaproteobacteria bacterium]